MTNDSAVGSASGQGASAPASTGQTASLGAALRRHVPLVLTCAVAGAALGGGVALSQPATYSSDSVVLVNPVVGAPFSPNSRGAAANLETEAQLVTTPALATYAQKALEADGASVDAETLRTNVTAVVPSSTQLLRITATGDSAAEAKRRAGAYASAFLSYRADRANETAARQLKTIADQRAGLEKQLSDATARLAASGVSAGEKGLLTERTNLITQQLSRLDDQASSLADVGASPGQVVTPSTEPSAARAGTVGLFAGSGALLGLLVGMVLALLRDRRDDRVHDAGDLAAAGVPVLAELPRSAATQTSALTATDGEAAQAVRRLRTAVLVAPGGAPRSVSVAAVGAVPAAAVAAGLAVSLARTGERTVLVDADPASDGQLAELLGATTGPGLAESLVEHRSAASLLQSTTLAPLSVLPAGTIAGLGDRLLSEDMRRGLVELGADGSWLVVNAAPATSADGEAVASLTGATVLVVQVGRTTWTELESAHRELTRLGTRVLGVVTLARPAHGSRGGRATRSSAPATATASVAGEEAAALDSVSSRR